jgi:hypothetical protein
LSIPRVSPTTPCEPDRSDPSGLHQTSRADEVEVIEDTLGQLEQTEDPAGAIVAVTLAPQEFLMSRGCNPVGWSGTYGVDEVGTLGSSRLKGGSDSSEPPGYRVNPKCQGV